MSTRDDEALQRLVMAVADRTPVDWEHECAKHAGLGPQLKKLRIVETMASLHSDAAPGPLFGKTLGRYRIGSRIGAGGMGVVYRAEDLSLHRPVALKVLPPELVPSEERRRRFLREARTAAAVTHPNIATVHEVGEDQGVVFIAMEFVEGKNLRQLLARRPLPIQDALRIACDIAEGLASAHQARVIHRDLKPDNVMVRSDHHVKILDFGLAKLREEHAGEGAKESTDLPTVSGEATREGKVLGTPSYMSPEQAQGRLVDARSDIFSFGTTLYEMVTGGLPFQGKSPTAILNAVMRDEPIRPSRHNASVPAELDRIIGKCLEKEPDERYHDTRDLVVDLRKLRRATDSGVQVMRGQVTPRRRLLPAIALAALVGLAATGALVGWLMSRLPGEERALRLKQLTANPAEGTVVDAAISPDGKYVAYLDPAGLHLLLLETGEAYPVSLPGELRLSRISWYPDGVHLIATGKMGSEEESALWAFSLMGGSPRRLRDDAWGGEVSPEGSRIAFLTGAWPSREIWTMGPTGEEPRRVAYGEGRDSFFWAIWAPDGRRIAYGRSPHGTAAPGYTIESRDRSGGSRTVLVSLDRLGQNLHGFPRPVWLPDGRLVFCRTDPSSRGGDSNLWEVRVNPRTGQPADEPRRISTWADHSVRNLTATADGKRMVFLKVRSQPDVYVGELREGGKRLEGARRITSDERLDYPETWAPDSRAIYFVSTRRGTWDIFKQAIGGSTAEQVAAGPMDEGGLHLSPDGASLLYLLSSGSAGADSSQSLMRVPLSGGAPEEVQRIPAEVGFDCPRAPGKPCVLGELRGSEFVLSTFTPGGEEPAEVARVQVDPARVVTGAVSPDGTRLAVANFGNSIRLVTLTGGAVQELQLGGWSLLARVAWAADGNSLFVDGAPEISRAPGRTTAILRVDLLGRAQVLLEHPNRWFLYPVPSPDGRYLAYSVVIHEGNAWIVEGF